MNAYATLTPPQPQMSQAERNMRRDIALSLDPVKFALSTGFRPDKWQVKFLRSPSKSRFLNCSRQVGKSTVVAHGVLHEAIYNRDSLSLLLSPGERQSGELMRKVFDVLDRVEKHPRVVSQGLLGVEFANGSRILALPGKEATVRGYSAVRKLVVDEASRVPDDLFLSIEPMLAVSGGDLWTLSSPFGKRGWWYEQYKVQMQNIKEHKPVRWDYYEVPATACPRISPAFLLEQRETMGEWWWKQEYFCEFLDAQSAAFSEADIDAAFLEEITPWILQSMSATVEAGSGLWTP